MKKIIVVIVVNKFSITLLVLQIWEICQTKKKKERILYYNFMYNIRDFYLYKYLKKKRKREREIFIFEKWNTFLYLYVKISLSNVPMSLDILQNISFKKMSNLK